MSVETPWKNPWYEPYTSTSFKGLWILITAMPIKEQTALADNATGGIKVGEAVDAFQFLAPNQIMETVNNTWSPWETIASRLAGKGKEIVQMYNEGSNLAGAMVDQAKGVNIGQFYKDLGKTNKEKLKVDTPLVYENTERREFTFQFNLTASTKGEVSLMLKTVRLLQQLSTPVKTDESYGLGIEFPHIFSLKTIPAPEDGYENWSVLARGNYMALTSIQPTYLAPYDDRGYPMRIELTMTFKELDPLYSDSFSESDMPGWG